MAATDENGSSFKHYRIPMLATPTHDHQLFSAFPKAEGTRKKSRKVRSMERDTPLVEYLSSRPESQRQARVAKGTPLSFQV